MILLPALYLRKKKQKQKQKQKTKTSGPAADHI